MDSRDRLAEIGAGVDGVDVPEHLVLAEVPAQAVVNSTGDSCAIFAAVADENGGIF
ncbi:MAG: hypothetical protein H7X91_04865 [Burkholderiales bacterium]|nr:hypothetical protein [Burkholderiales bacterium]